MQKQWLQRECSGLLDVVTALKTLSVPRIAVLRTFA
jgi:hypothetical protein